MILLMRSLLFYFLVFLFVTIPYFLIIPLTCIFPRAFTLRINSLWCKSALFLLRFCIGLGYEIRGRENLDKLLESGRFIIASQHQSAWDAMFFPSVLKTYRAIIKKALLFIPVFGWYFYKADFIAIDRSAGIKSIKKLLTDGKKSMKEGVPIFMFPEGTRTEFGADVPYQPGIAALYKGLDVPILPVALNSGLFWKRRGIIKYPGTVIVHFLEPIQPGLSKEVFMTTLKNRINEGAATL
ncbi:MAG: lysophospholipid acyltransferase family protein [Alphaproteobacteria bacterium]|nr:lysophospholipid acyltransferase family protein [Alphaproteobacteria bacterium]